MRRVRTGLLLVAASLTAAGPVVAAQSKEPESTIRRLDGGKLIPPAAAGRAPVSAPPAASIPVADSSVMQAGRAALKKQDWSGALKDFKMELAERPGNREAALLAGNAALAMRDFTQAMSYYQALLRTDADDWRTRIQLVQAYGGAGMSGARDLERGKLRAMHLARKDAAFAKQNAFVVESIDFDLGADAGLGLKTQVDAVEFFVPTGPTHVSYTFVVSGADGKPIERLNLEGMDAGGSSRRAYELAMYTGEGKTEKRGVIKRYASPPEYAVVRSDVLTALKPAQ